MASFAVGIVGCGVVAQGHVENGYNNLRDLAEVVAVCDPRLERAQEFAGKLGARAYGSLDEMLTHPGLGGVDICTPHPLHAAQTLQALDAGKHVLVEKPIATTVPDAEAMVAKAREKNLVLCINEQYPFSAPFRRARQLIDAGDIGKLVMVRTHRVGFLRDMWLRDGWRHRTDLAGGGMLLDQGCHYVNILRGLAGEVTHVSAYATTVRDDWRAEDTAVLILRFASGLLGEQLYCWGTRTPEVGPEAYAYGENGHLEINSRAPHLVLYRSDLPDGRQVIDDAQNDQPVFTATIGDFVRAALGEKEPVMPGSEGLADLRVVDAAYRSIESGRSEPV